MQSQAGGRGEGGSSSCALRGSALHWRCGPLTGLAPVLRRHGKWEASGSTVASFSLWPAWGLMPWTVTVGLADVRVVHCAPCMGLHGDRGALGMSSLGKAFLHSELRGGNWPREGKLPAGGTQPAGMEPVSRLLDGKGSFLWDSAGSDWEEIVQWERTPWGTSWLCSSELCDLRQVAQDP